MTSEPAYRPTTDLPYPSARQPVMARNVVATSQPLAAQAGLRMLLQGGNAADAAIAAAIALTVVEPTGNGIGSDAFAILWDGSRLHGLNASGRSPARLDAARLISAGAIEGVGWDPVTVPGAVAAWVELSRRHGRLPFATLFEPAVAYAEEGFPVSPGVAHAWQRAGEVLGVRADFADAFLPAGRAPVAGEVWRSGPQARTLTAIAESNGDEFYLGALADAMVAAAEAEGAALRHDDLAAHRAEWVGTLATGFGGFELHEIPPNGQGLAALIALGVLRHTNIVDLELDSAAWLHLQIEAMKLGFADAHRYVADSDHLDIDVSVLLDDGYLAERAAKIDVARASDPGHGRPRPGGTVYLTTADRDGMMVSFIQSNYRGFGSGVVVPGTGIALTNRGLGFSLDPGHPNVVAPGKRPFNTIIPGFLTGPAGPLASFGVMGGPMQPQGHLQLALRALLHDQNPQAASDAPRWQVTGGLGVNLEPGYAPEVIEELRSRGHALRVTAPEEDQLYGGAQMIARLATGDGGDVAYIAGSDHRKDGQATGF